MIRLLDPMASRLFVGTPGFTNSVGSRKRYCIPVGIWKSISVVRSFHGPVKGGPIMVAGMGPPSVVPDQVRQKNPALNDAPVETTPGLEEALFGSVEMATIRKAVGRKPGSVAGGGFQPCGFQISGSCKIAASPGSCRLVVETVGRLA